MDCHTGVRIISAEFATERERLLTERATIERKIDEVKGLLARADERVKADPENRRRWSTVVENLENSLTELRARLQLNEIELKQADGPSSPVATPMPMPGHPLTESSTNLLESVAQMSVVDASGLNLEQAARIESALQAGEAALDPAHQARVQARLEIANQSSPVQDQPDEGDLPARRLQLALRTAVDKIQGGRIDTMSPEEVRMTVACYDLIRRRVNPTPGDQRLTRILGAAINILNRKHAEFSKR